MAGYEKPAKEVFDQALALGSKKQDIKASQALHIGDDIKR
jgi:FMN phosphatase YigB (HAD superfamily)